jgi:hypothetical protein
VWQEAALLFTSVGPDQEVVINVSQTTERFVCALLV